MSPSVKLIGNQDRTYTFVFGLYHKEFRGGVSEKVPHHIALLLMKKNNGTSKMFEVTNVADLIVTASAPGGHSEQGLFPC